MKLTFEIDLPSTTVLLVDVAKAARACAELTRYPDRRDAYAALAQSAEAHAARWLRDHPEEEASL